jgi:very-short-patch-repair endonuclease
MEPGGAGCRPCGACPSISPHPFRGSAAIAAALLTRGQLRGSRFQRLFPDVYAPADLEPDLALRSAAAAVLVEGRAVLAGYSAAELLGASCGPTDAPAEVLMLRPGRQSYRGPGLRVHRGLVDPAEITLVGPYAVTTPARTAFDLVRWVPTLREKVVALDALARNCKIALDDVLRLRALHLGARGTHHIVPVLKLCDPRAESPMETRIRIALHEHGLPAPHVQFEVEADGRIRRLDLAYPSVELAIEYDGRDHREQERAHNDLLREAALVRLGWTILRFDACTVYWHPARIAQAVAYELRRRATSPNDQPRRSPASA